MVRMTKKAFSKILSFERDQILRMDFFNAALLFESTQDLESPNSGCNTWESSLGSNKDPKDSKQPGVFFIAPIRFETYVKFSAFQVVGAVVFSDAMLGLSTDLKVVARWLFAVLHVYHPWDVSQKHFLIEANFEEHAILDSERVEIWTPGKHRKVLFCWGSYGWF